MMKGIKVMKQKAGNTLYIRLDFKIGDEWESEQEAMESLEYLQKLTKERYLKAGLLGDLEAQIFDGALVIFEAKSYEEAEELVKNDPIIKKGFYRYELYKWNIQLVSGEEGE